MVACFAMLTSGTTFQALQERGKASKYHCLSAEFQESVRSNARNTKWPPTRLAVVATSLPRLALATRACSLPVSQQAVGGWP